MAHFYKPPRIERCPYPPPPGLKVITTGKHVDNEGGMQPFSSETTIRFEDYGIVNPLLIRGLTGFLELGLLRDPQDLIKILSCFAANRDPEKTFFLGDILKVTMDLHSRVEGFSKQALITDSLLGMIYGGFEQITKKNLIYIINDLSLVSDQQLALGYLDLLIETFIANRMIILGHGQTRESGNAEHIATELIIRNLRTLNHLYEQTYGVSGDINEKWIEIIVDQELISARTFMGEIRPCPPRRRGVVYDPYNRGGFLEDLGDPSGRRLHEGDADGCQLIRLVDGTIIKVFKVQACPFFAQAYHKY